MKQVDYILSNQKDVLAFLKSHYPMFHLSNIFFRDIQFGVQKMLERRGEKVTYVEAEKIARAFADKLEKEKILSKIDQQSWVLNYPEFKKPQAAPVAPAKPAPGAAPAKSPAATPAAARPALPPLGAKPAAPAGAKPALPPLGSAKPALPPLASAKPVGAASPAEAKKEADAPTPPRESPAAEPPKQAAAAPADGAKKTLPPLGGKYTPAGKK